MAMTDRAAIAVLEVDPDLGALLPDDEREEATRALTAHLHVVEPGPWAGERLRGAGAEHLGLLLLDGMVAREVALADNVSAELLGPGDLVRPWQAAAPERLVPYGVRWTVLETARFAVLDSRFARAAARYPSIGAMIADRFAERGQRLALMQAIAQLNGVDRRLLTLYWHLAERWGRVTADGVLVEVSVPHRLLAELVGARRPTVSTALTRLSQTGELVRGRDDTWLLTGAPIGLPTEEAARIVRRRRRRLDPIPAGTVAVEPAEGEGRMAELHGALSVLRADSERRRAEFDVLRGRTAELVERLSVQRARRRDTLRDR